MTEKSTWKVSGMESFYYYLRKSCSCVREISSFLHRYPKLTIKNHSCVTFYEGLHVVSSESQFGVTTRNISSVVCLTSVDSKFSLLSYRRDCVTKYLNFAGLHITSSKTQRKELSILLSSYFHELLEPLKTNIQKNFHCERSSWFCDTVRLNF